MSTLFNSLDPTKVEKYISLLSAVGSLSRLFSESETPYLHYRAHENIYCLTLDASNESRGDVSVDAVIEGVGIGLKTFLYRNTQYEKVAEFNKLIGSYSNLSGRDLALVIAHARNDRINTTKRMYNLDSIIYHCIARKKDTFIVYEEAMDLINTGLLEVDAETDKQIDFHDDKNSYRFYRAKSTLFKRFVPGESIEFSVEIMDDPYSFILNKASVRPQIRDVIARPDEVERGAYVILPLYSDRSAPVVHERSALNQWNAGGRARSSDEVYIPIPSWIHQAFEDFFPGRDVPFSLELPGGAKIDAKVCQEGGKALMSNPNSDLGDWLLRKVLDLDEGELLTYEKLLTIGIDSVMITKRSPELFEIDFKAVGSYEDFKQTNKPTV